MAKNRRKAKSDKPLKGGLGGVPAKGPIQTAPACDLIDGRTPGKDLKLIHAAVKNGWLIPERAFGELPEAMLGLALSAETDDRARVSAAKVLCTMHGQATQAKGTTVNVGVVVNNGEDLLD